MMASFVYDPIPADKQFLECAVCLEPWRDAVELTPCGHIFCKACVRAGSEQQCLTACPECRSAVAGHQKPNRMLLNMIAQLPGKCSACTWVGSEEAFAHHPCATATGVPLQMKKEPKHLSSTPPSEQRCGAAPTVTASHAEENTPKLWEEYGLSSPDYCMIMSALASVRCGYGVPTTIAARTTAHGKNAGVEDDSVKLDFARAQVFARLVAMPSLDKDIASVFGDFGLVAQPTTTTASGAAGVAVPSFLNLHQVLLWCSNVARDVRPADRRFMDITASEFTAVLLELHELADFKRHGGVLKLPRDVQLVVECRDMVKRATSSTEGSANDSSSQANLAQASTRCFDRVFKATRSQVPLGYPPDGVLLREVLMDIASQDEGFEFCDVSPRPQKDVIAKQQAPQPFPAVGRERAASQSANVASQQSCHSTAQSATVGARIAPYVPSSMHQRGAVAPQAQCAAFSPATQPYAYAAVPAQQTPFVGVRHPPPPPQQQQGNPYSPPYHVGSNVVPFQQAQPPPMYYPPPPQPGMSQQQQVFGTTYAAAATGYPAAHRQQQQQQHYTVFRPQYY